MHIISAAEFPLFCSYSARKCLIMPAKCSPQKSLIMLEILPAEFIQAYQAEPLLRSFCENWEYLCFPRRSKETVHRVQSVQFLSREPKYFRSEKHGKMSVLLFLFFFFVFPLQCILQQQIIIRKTANAATLSGSTRFNIWINSCAQFQGKISLFPLRKRHYIAENNVMDLLVKQVLWNNGIILKSTIQFRYYHMGSLSRQANLIADGLSEATNAVVSEIISENEAQKLRSGSSRSVNSAFLFSVT